MANLTLESLIAELPNINPNRKYWFIRTYGGSYYDDFVGKGYVAIGHNEITLLDLNRANQSAHDGYEALVNRIERLDPKNTRPAYTAQQLLKFAYEVRRGDLVMIPSYSSDLITFGYVTSIAAYSEETPDCPFRKRRKVRWIKTISREALEPSLYKLMYTHHTVTDANSYATFIDRTLNSFFIKGDSAHFIIDVRSLDGINAFGTFKMGYNLLDLTEFICKKEGIPFNPDEVDLKCDLNSPGKIELKSKHVVGITIAALLIYGVIGGGGTMSYKDLKIDMHSDGLIKEYNQYLNDKAHREAQKKIIDTTLKSLHVTTPEDFVKAVSAAKKDS